MHHQHPSSSFKSHHPRPVVYSDSQHPTPIHDLPIYSKGVNVQLLPNEMRISTKGSYKMYLDYALKALSEYTHLKIVARGQAVAMAEELATGIAQKQFNFACEKNFTQGLNKTGVLVQEVHIVFTKNEGQPSQSSSSQQQ